MDFQKNEERVTKAFEESTVQNRNLSLQSMSFSLICIVLTLSTSDLMLFLPNVFRFNIPLVEAKLNIKYFYLIAPLCLLFLHYNYLVNLSLHSLRLGRWLLLMDEIMYEKIANKIDYHTKNTISAETLQKEERPHIKRYIHYFFFNYLVIPFRVGAQNYFFRSIIFFFVFVLPFIAHLLMFCRFMAYQNSFTSIFLFIVLALHFFTIMIYTHKVYYPIKNSLKTIDDFSKKRKTQEGISKDKTDDRDDNDNNFFKSFCELFTTNTQCEKIFAITMLLLLTSIIICFIMGTIYKNGYAIFCDWCAVILIVPALIGAIFGAWAYRDRENKKNHTPENKTPGIVIFIKKIITTFYTNCIKPLIKPLLKPIINPLAEMFANYWEYCGRLSFIVALFSYAFYLFTIEWRITRDNPSPATMATIMKLHEDIRLPLFIPALTLRDEKFHTQLFASDPLVGHLYYKKLSEGRLYRMANFSNVSFEGFTFENVGFEYSQLNRAQFNRSTLINCRFDSATLLATSFDSCLIQSTHFNNQLRFARFYRSAILNSRFGSTDSSIWVNTWYYGNNPEQVMPLAAYNSFIGPYNDSSSMTWKKAAPAGKRLQSDNHRFYWIPRYNKIGPAAALPNLDTRFDVFKSVYPLVAYQNPRTGSNEIFSITQLLNLVNDSCHLRQRVDSVLARCTTAAPTARR